MYNPKEREKLIKIAIERLNKNTTVQCELEKIEYNDRHDCHWTKYTFTYLKNNKTVHNSMVWNIYYWCFDAVAFAEHCDFDSNEFLDLSEHVPMSLPPRERAVVRIAYLLYKQYKNLLAQ